MKPRSLNSIRSNSQEVFLASTLKLAAALLLAGAGATQAAVITVPNSSWEDSTSLTDQWTFAITNDNGNPSSSRGVNTNGVAFGAPSANYAFMQSGYFQRNELTSAASLGSIVSGETYTLTIALRNTTDTLNFLTNIRLLGDGSQLATTSLSASDISTSSWNDYMVSYTALAGDAGKALTINIQGYAEYNGGDFSDLYIDNVRLTSVPEPSAVLLLTAACMGFSLRRRRA